MNFCNVNNVIKHCNEQQELFVFSFNFHYFLEKLFLKYLVLLMIHNVSLRVLSSGSLPTLQGQFKIRIM